MTTSRPLDRVIDEVLEKISLVEIVGADVRLNRKGNEFWGLCPFHSEKSPSFKVDAVRHFYHCFGCGAHGNALDYVIQRQNLPFKDALTYLAERAGVTLPEFSRASAQESQHRKDLYSLHEKAKEYAHRLLKTSPQAEEARAYLAQRGLSEKVIDAFQLGFCDGSLTAYLRKFAAPQQLIDAGLSIEVSGVLKDRFAQRILFPITDLQRRVVAFGGRILETGTSDAHKSPKYLNSKESELFHKGHQLYNLYTALSAAKGKPLILVEGYMDVLSMTAYGFPQTVAALGTALTETHMETLWRYSPQPILCFDGDAAGLKASLRALERALPLLKPAKTFFFCYLPNGQDPDDLLRKGGAEAMQTCLDAALPLSDVLWTHLIQPYEEKNAGRDRWIPEDWAALKNDIFATLKTLKDNDIREFYRKLLLDRFHQKQWIPRLPSSQKHRGRALAPSPSPSRQEIGQKILLGILLKNPILLLNVEELMARVNVTDPALRGVQLWLLSQSCTEASIDSEEERQQREAFLEVIGLRLLRTHAAFLFDGALPQDELLRRWREIWLCTVERDEVRGDLQQAYKELREHETEEAWERVKMLVTSVNSWDQDTDKV